MWNVHTIYMAYDKTWLMEWITDNKISINIFSYFGMLNRHACVQFWHHFYFHIFIIVSFCLIYVNLSIVAIFVIFTKTRIFIVVTIITTNIIFSIVIFVFVVKRNTVLLMMLYQSLWYWFGLFLFNGTFSTNRSPVYCATGVWNISHRAGDKIINHKHSSAWALRRQSPRHV